MKTLFKFTKISWATLGLTLVFLTSCGSKDARESEIDQVTVDFSVERFDQLFYDTPVAELGNLKRTYPYLFPKQFDDAFWAEKKRDTLFEELHSEVEKKFADLGGLTEELTGFFKHIKYYFPEQDPKRVVTLISEVDVTSKAIYADSLVLISLDTYLGEDHRFYKGFPEYMRPTFESSQVLPDLAESFAISRISVPSDRSLLAQMIYQGKILYTKELLLPKMPKENLITYTKAQFDWCRENEAEMWRYFIENKLLFDTDTKLHARFVQASPFSKFYLDIDAESPGRVGAWLGWQIVGSYMRNNNVTLQELFAKDAKVLFEESRYKPKK